MSVLFAFLGQRCLLGFQGVDARPEVSDALATLGEGEVPLLEGGEVPVQASAGRGQLLTEGGQTPLHLSDPMSTLLRVM